MHSFRSYWMKINTLVNNSSNRHWSNFFTFVFSLLQDYRIGTGKHKFTLKNFKGPLKIFSNIHNFFYLNFIFIKVFVSTESENVLDQLIHEDISKHGALFPLLQCHNRTLITRYFLTDRSYFVSRRMWKEAHFHRVNAFFALNKPTKTSTSDIVFN